MRGLETFDTQLNKNVKLEPIASLNVSKHLRNKSFNDSINDQNLINNSRQVY